jgi:hypothetical protein
MTRLVNIAGYHSDNNVRERLTQSKEMAEKAGWSHYMNDAPVRKELLDLAYEVKKVLPNVTFLPVDWTRINYNGTVLTIYTDLSICMEGFPYDVGRINYDDNTVRRSGADMTYGVYSRRIANAKFSPHREQHRMIMSTDIKKAVKNVCKYVVPYNTKELAQAFYDGFKTNVDKPLGKVKGALQEHVRNLGGNTNLFVEELLHLNAMGVKFKTQDFKQASEGLEEKYQAYKAELDRKINGVFVRTYMVGDTPHVSLLEVPKVRELYAWKPLPDTEVVDKPLAELDETNAGTISVLSILNNQQYVDHVGMKLDANHFWIEKEIV